MASTTSNQISGLYPLYYTMRETTSTREEEKLFFRTTTTITQQTVDKVKIFGYVISQINHDSVVTKKTDYSCCSIQ